MVGHLYPAARRAGVLHGGIFPAGCDAPWGHFLMLTTLSMTWIKSVPRVTIASQVPSPCAPA
jgi:hypothetical protein